MAIRKIAQMGEPILRQRARELEPHEIVSERTRALLADMIETMRDANGAGLAAPQVYESVQLVVIEVHDNPRYPGAEAVPLTVLANPRITPLVSGPLDALRDEEAIVTYEGCLSVTGIRGRVRRPRRVRVQALDAEARPVDEIWEGFRAAVVQHETDHLFGTLFVDRVDTRTLTFLREYERYVPPELRLVDGAKGGAP
ncbi:MAG: peptide deformylase [Pseudomonadota bacterium]|nr:MAG: peptide deformylase [Pseudomonadota bacterium]